MIDFEFKGIRIKAMVEMEQRTYKDADGRQRTRFDRNVLVSARFWDFIIWNGNLNELAFVKSTLNYFMQCYWKRTSKEGSKIDLLKVLYREDSHTGQQSLHFTSRQKDKKHFLQISFVQQFVTVNETYLDGQEVIMLDIAIGKAVSLLAPTAADRVETVF